MDQLQQLVQTAPMIAMIIEGTLDVRVDFTPASLRRIEKAINRVYPIGHEPMTTTILSYGIYLGEVFARNVPETKWGPYSVDVMGWHFRAHRGDRMFIGYPLKRVHDFWFDRSKELYAFYEMNVDALEGKLDMELSDQWKSDEHGKYVYRFPTSIRIDKEQ